MDDIKPRSNKRHWWTKESSIVDQIMDDDLIRLLEDVESEFKNSYEYHAQRLRELKEAIRARQETE